ncbi:MAG: alpha/beta fold hydrolase [Rhodospirillales bacterium]|jgi:pimeloyl-[acyl-carrier protein] methyl ester esterase
MNAKPVIVFVHGWGFDAHLWDGICSALADFQTVTVDLGFRGGGTKMPEKISSPVIAVGHSLGFMWLLKNKPFPWQKLVSINGFSKFLAADDFPSGLDARILSVMTDQCRKNAPAVVTDFLKTCGQSEAVETLDHEALVQGLAWLRDWDMRKTLARETAPVMALAGLQDTIVPKALSEACFPARKNTKLHWHNGAHLLPLSAPNWCADRIREFAVNS